MLVLGRRENQSIRIHTTDGIIEILITQLDDRLVKLGFDAPGSVKILRSEIDPSAGNYLPPLNAEKLKHHPRPSTFYGLKSLVRKLVGLNSSR